MTIEQKALELVNAVRAERGLPPHGTPYIQRVSAPDDEALCRALEARELDKSRHAAELREQAERFSEACEAWLAKWKHGTPSRDDFKSHFWPYLPAPVDPLVEAANEALPNSATVYPDFAERLRAALDARGLAIVKKEAVNG